MATPPDGAPTAPDAGWAPLHHTPLLGSSSDGLRVAGFSERFLVASKGMRAGQPFRFEAWQRWALSFALQRNDAGLFQYRQVVLGMPRKVAKSMMGAAICLYYLVGQPGLGRELYSIAGDRQQAKLVFGEARWQVLNNPVLSRELAVFRDALEHRATGSVYRVLSHDGKLAQGLNPFLTVADEAHVYPGSSSDPRTSELWEAMAQGGGARPESLLLAITTAGSSYETLLGRLYQYGLKVASGEVADPAFGMAWWAAPEGCDHRDESVWLAANPNLGLGLADVEEMRAAMRTTPEMVFRRYRLNQFIHGGGSGWMNMAAWESQTDEGWSPAPGSRVCLGFDGSVSDDGTALVAVTVPPRNPRSRAEQPHVFVLGYWQRPQGAGDDWQVPRGEVMEAVDDAFNLFDVRMLAFDPAYWSHEGELWARRYGSRRVVQFKMSNARMAPAVQEFYSAVLDGRLWHAGDARLTAHVRNAMLRETPAGATISKDAKDSPRKIDLAVAACIAHDALLRVPARSGPMVAGF